MDEKDVKRTLKKPVLFRNTEYIFNRCCLDKDEKKGFYYLAELLDRCKHSVIVCRLEEIEKKEA